MKQETFPQLKLSVCPAVQSFSVAIVVFQSWQLLLADCWTHTWYRSWGCCCLCLLHCLCTAWYGMIHIYSLEQTYCWHVTFVPKNWILCLSSYYVAHLESRNNQDGAQSKHRMSTRLDVHSQQNILFQERGAAKGNAKLFPFHGWKLPALADLPQAPAGAQCMWILNKLHFPTTKRQWKGRDNTFENWDNIQSWSLLLPSCLLCPPFSFSPSLLLPVSSCLPISWDPQHSFRPGLLGRIKWGNEVSISWHSMDFLESHRKKERKKGVPPSTFQTWR